ncbi:hypothetical protein, partial [Flavobacterium filum]|uniref:hypothetical protein n=1 Tax=Flavobacterium filum TaxID=370974 RepID=UPI0023F45802
ADGTAFCGRVCRRLLLETLHLTMRGFLFYMSCPKIGLDKSITYENRTKIGSSRKPVDLKKLSI